MNYMVNSEKLEDILTDPAKAYGHELVGPLSPPSLLPSLSQQCSPRPPPYRMPPYPLHNEPNIPGATTCDALGLASTSTFHSSVHQGLYTHSNKFPVQREVVLSSTDKNSKIPILNDYKKRSKVAIAPDIPPIQMAAWTSQGQTQKIMGLDENPPGILQAINQEGDQSNSVQECYKGFSSGASYEAVPQHIQHFGEAVSTQFQENFSELQHLPVHSEQSPPKEVFKDKKYMSRTYNTIKDIISNKFKSHKDMDEKCEVPELNNVVEKLHKKKRNTNEQPVQTSNMYSNQDFCGKVRMDQNIPLNQHHYNHHLAQKQVFKNSQENPQYQTKPNRYDQQTIPARKQEMIRNRTDEKMFYQGGPRLGARVISEENPVPISRLYTSNNFLNVASTQEREDRQLMAIEPRSPQQIERDSQRQKNFEARRALSQPQLAFQHDGCVQPQSAVTRRGSHGNIIEASASFAIADDTEKDSDDGGFLQRDNLQGNITNNKPCQNEVMVNRITEVLEGTPRKQLEGEIGKIEGVYNVEQRSNTLDARKKNTHGSLLGVENDKTGVSSSNIDSGRGSAACSSGRRSKDVDLNKDALNDVEHFRKSQHQLNNSEWVDIVENELMYILEPKLHELSVHANTVAIANSTLSESVSSMSPPLPPLSPGEQSSPNMTPKHLIRPKHNSLSYGGKVDYDAYSKSSKFTNKSSNGRNHQWRNDSSQKYRNLKTSDQGLLLRGKQNSITTRSLDSESVLDGHSETDCDDSTTDTRTIRKQLESLETMYAEILKLLCVKKHTNKYQPSDPRFSKRRHGSVSSLPSSSISSRPIRDKRRIHEDKKKVRDIRGVNNRFQRLESHVVTLARSVAHLSSEMRTQHLMIQEMEDIRGEISALRTQTNMLNVRSQTTSRAVNSSTDIFTLTNPIRVKKLTKFFGDEPPLVRLFLRKLGYEKYANIFENERISMVELPYLNEERLQKMGIPLGPRLRIMQEAHISVSKENTLCIV